MARRGFSDTAAGLLLIAASVAALVSSVAYYFVPGNGISGSLGVLLVIGSTLLMTLAAAATAFWLRRGFARRLFSVLILLDILGTGFAAYMLEAVILLGLMALALVAWLFGLVSREAPSPSNLAKPEASI